MWVAYSVDGDCDACDGRVFDNEQGFHLFRLLPLEVGYKKTWEDLGLRVMASAYYYDYEDLITDPRTTLEKLCPFLGLEFSETMLAAADEQA